MKEEFPKCVIRYENRGSQLVWLYDVSCWIPSAVRDAGRAAQSAAERRGLLRFLLLAVGGSSSSLSTTVEY